MKNEKPFATQEQALNRGVIGGGLEGLQPPRKCYIVPEIYASSHWSEKCVYICHQYRTSSYLSNIPPFSTSIIMGERVKVTPGHSTIVFWLAAFVGAMKKWQTKSMTNIVCEDCDGNKNMAPFNSAKKTRKQQKTIQHGKPLFVQVKALAETGRCVSSTWSRNHLSTTTGHTGLWWAEKRCFRRCVFPNI